MAQVIHFGEDDEPDDIKHVNSELGDAKDDRAVEKKSKLTIKAMLTPWMAGASYTELAQMFDLPSAAAARHAIERALVESAPDTQGDRSMLVKKASMTLDMLQRSVMAKALDGKNPDQRGYIDTVLKVMDRKAALFGLNAPSTLLVASPGEDDLASFIEQLAVASGGSVPEEADPFVEMIQDEDGEWRVADEDG